MAGPYPSGLDAARAERLWRLAFLMAGDRDRAARLLADVLTQRAEQIAAKEQVHVDRLLLQHAREMFGKESLHQDAAPPPADAPGGRRLFAALHTLRRQPMEAWILTNVERLDEIHVARAMDCSKSAMSQFLRQAEEHLQREFSGELDGAARELRDLSRQVNAADGFARAREHISERRRRRLVRRWLPLAIVLLLALVVVLSIVL